MQFELTVLGNNSALPAHGRYPSAQVLLADGHPYLIDCGEGTQMRLRKYDIRFMKIGHIFISHLHGDHVYGLPGLINSFGHHGRQQDLHIYGPNGIREFLETILRLSQSRMEFKIIYHEQSAQNKQAIHDDTYVKVYAFPLKHRILTYGYLFEQKPGERNIKVDAIREYNLDFQQIRAVKAGQDIEVPTGRIIRAEDLLEPPRPAHTYAYCSDTRYNPELLPVIRHCSLLYHEATFLHEAVGKAEYSMHTTASEAGNLAAAAEVGGLLIGHFSSRYDDLQPLLEEARQEFSGTLLALEGNTYQIPLVL
jgi:ribonuclease Z